MHSIDLKAHAKINIGLQVNESRSDGYHNIHTVFQEIELHDSITLKKTPNGWNIKSNVADIPNDEKNICVQAYLILKKHFPQMGGISIVLTKKIPSGAGLGGGSSDAAAVLKGIKKIYNLPINTKNLSKMAVKIGADVPFFINGGTQIGDGIGDVLTPLNKPIGGFYLLIVPDIFISTAWAYNAFKKHLKSNLNRPNFADFFERSKLSKAIFDNDFEQIVIPTYPKIGKIMEGLVEAGAHYASLSGSGSTVFGIFDEEAKAKLAESYFQGHYRTFLSEPTNK